MGKDWDAPWKTGAGMSKPGIGDRAIEWPAHGGSSPFGGANPTCNTCGGRLRGAKKCGCEEPDWYVDGKAVGMSEALKQKHLFQDWCKLWLTECYRILQPGGVIKVFGGTRMFHRMAKAIEEVGFILDPSESLEAWMYGCLSEDTEILTKTGWKLGIDVEVGEQVACWNHESGQITLGPVEQVVKSPFKGELVRFVNDNTDQLLTPNHRVYKKHRIRKMVGRQREVSEEAEWQVQEAGSINRWNSLRLPIAGSYCGPGIGGEDYAALLAWVWTEGGFDKTGTGVRIYQSSVNQPYVDEIQALLGRVAPEHKRYDRIRLYKGREYTESCWFFSGPRANQVRESLPNKQPDWRLLWGMSTSEQSAFVSAAIKGDGSFNSHQTGTFYQKNLDDLVWFQTLAHLMNRQGRINFKKRCVGLHENPMTQLQSRHLKSSASQPYDGLVWCVQVPTGAFLARRGDKVFITGNSGFPKSMSLGKAIDKAAGAEREVVGYDASRARPNRQYEGGAIGNVGGNGKVSDRSDNGATLTAPATEEAERFEAYGTALKPAWEPFIVARKPV